DRQRRRQERKRAVVDPRCALSPGVWRGALGRSGPRDQKTRHRPHLRVRAGARAHRHGQADRARSGRRHGLRSRLARPGGDAPAMNAPAISGQVALVTGASRGIGRAIAQLLAERGFRVVGTATSESGAAGIGEALAAHAGCRGIVLDVTDGDAVGTSIDAVVRDLGALHVLVNNAGITRDQLSMRMKDEDWDVVLATNLSAVFRASRAAIRPMMKQRYGRIVNITSVVGASGNAGQANYAAAKAGVAGMTRALAREVGSRGITVNCVAPGFIETDMTRALGEAQSAALLSQIPLGRLGQPVEIAHAVAFLASPEASYITGTELHVNGGMFMS